MGPVDQTMQLLGGASGDAAFVPLTQLGAGPDGNVTLCRQGDRLIELHQLRFGPKSPRWPELDQRIRAIGAVDHPTVRRVLALDADEATVTLEGDSYPPLAELLDQASVDVLRGLRILTEVARGIAAAHHVGVFHGHLNPWSIWIGPGDRPRIELTRLRTRTVNHDAAKRCLSAEASDGIIDAAADVFALGAILEQLAARGGKAQEDQLRAIIRDATATDPEARPAMTELVRRLQHAALGSHGATNGNGRATLLDDDPPPRPSGTFAIGTKFGRFELQRQLGAGAMGEVWRARDTTGGPDVAIKLLKGEIANDSELLHRFRKEARVLTKVGSPYIANFVDLNEDRGQHYLVLELVPGGSVGVALRKLGKLPEKLALGIVADACRALAEPHRLGIVHRDLKPDNMMFVREGIELESQPQGQLIKLGDFGIARATEAEVPGATREGAVLGTPEYMAPEQCQGAQVTAATDVYALGCCLFALIAGRPPFVATDDRQMEVILQHLNQPSQRLDVVLVEATPAVADLVERCLAKDPRNRPADATELLAAIEQLTGGTAALITAHPAAPIHREKRIITYSFAWELKASPEALWPYISNTEKLNRAIGMTPVRFEIETVENPTRVPDQVQTGRQRVAGIQLVWREHPFEWIEGNRQVVLRVFQGGLLRWYIAETTLERLATGGTKLRHTIRIEPRSFLATWISKFEVGFKYRRRIGAVYQRIDRVLATGASPEVDPIAPEVSISPAVRAKVARAVEQLRVAGVDPAAADALAAYLLGASDQDVARIRPLELAAKFGVPADAMIDAALHATRLGVLAMVWDVICPSCRIPSSVVESLAKIEEHARCKACNLSYGVDFSRAIELVFRAAPEIREVETRTYCLGGPGHFPHVAAQIRLAPGERFALPLALAAGYYVVRSPQLARGHELRVISQGGVRRIDLTVGERGECPAMTAGDQLITLVNPEQRELVVRVERVGERVYALTAARVMACAAFRDLFPDQALAPGRLMAVTQAALLIAQVDDAATLFRELGDAKAFPVAARFYEQVSTIARDCGGSLIKTFGGLAVAGFERAGSAIEAALGLQAAVDADPVTSGLRCRIAVHRGPMMALTQGGRLDYFGRNVELAVAAASVTPPAAVGVTQAAYQDEAVAERLAGQTDQLGIQQVPDGGWIMVFGSRRASARALPAAFGTSDTLMQ
ncbi:MAG: protein kinase [Kofleriaceae bacterium]